MNVVVAARVFIAPIMTISLVLIPRLLYYFKARAEALDVIMSPWFTFIVFLIVGGLFTYSLLKNIKLAILIVLCIIGAAILLTFYFCQLSLPW